MQGIGINKWALMQNNCAEGAGMTTADIALLIIAVWLALSLIFD